MEKFDISLYLVTNSELSKNRSHKYIVEQAVKGGVSMVQLREKNLNTKDFFLLAKELLSILKPLNIPLIINDRLDIALAVDADGIHIGQSDMPYSVVRKLMGKDKIIGLSVETIQEARDANSIDVDYIAISPVFTTQTKADIASPLGLEGIREISSFSKHKILSIGGINTSNTKQIFESGAHGIAVVSAIVSQDSPKQAAQEFRNIISSLK